MAKTEKEPLTQEDLVNLAATADGALNACLRYFLGTGPQPTPEGLGEGELAMRSLKAHIEAEAAEALES